MRVPRCKCQTYVQVFICCLHFMSYISNVCTRMLMYLYNYSSVPFTQQYGSRESSLALFIGGSN